MQVDITTVIGIISTICSLGLGAWLAVAKVALTNREKDIDRRLDDLRGDLRGIDTRLHAEEKSTIRQDGEIRLVQSTHDNLTSDMHEIRRTMVTKAEFAQLGRTTEQILARLDGRENRRFPSGSTSAYAQQQGASESPKIPRREPSRPDR